jgi:hypothetical protein
MPKLPVRRVRVCTRLSLPVRDRLTKYCAASGIAERAVIEDALQQYLAGKSDRDHLAARFDHIARTMADDRRELELLSEAFGVFVRVWFAHAPVIPEEGKAAALSSSEARYKRFAEHLGDRFTEGHRFRDDVPATPLEKPRAAECRSTQGTQGADPAPVIVSPMAPSGIA